MTFTDLMVQATVCPRTPARRGRAYGVLAAAVLVLPALLLAPEAGAQRRGVRRQGAAPPRASTAVKAELADPDEYFRKAARGTPGKAPGTRDDRASDDDARVEATGGGASGPSARAKSDIEFESRPQVQGTRGRYIRFNVSNLGGPDPMVAVGDKYVLAANNDRLAFFDKSDGRQVRYYKAADLFAVWLSPQDANGNPNPHYLNTVYNVPADVPAQCSTSEDPNDTTDGLINEAYDVRVAYEKGYRRYVVAAALRNHTRRPSRPECEGLVIRLIGWCVFDENLAADIYRTGENNVRDFPRMTVDQDYLVFAHDGEGYNHTSIATFFSFPDMAQRKLPLRSFTLERRDIVTPRSLIPVQNHLPSLDTLFFLEKPDKENFQAINVWYLKKPDIRSDIFKDPPRDLRQAGRITFPSAKFEHGLSGVVHHKDAIWLATSEQVYSATGTLSKGRALNVFKIPVVRGSQGKYSIAIAPPYAFPHEHYANPDYSFDKPAVAVNTLGDLMVSFLRYPRDANTSRKSQIRVKPYFHGESEPRGSALVKESGTAGNKKMTIHYSWIAGDPFDHRFFWVAHMFLDTKGEREMHLERVDILDFK